MVSARTVMLVGFLGLLLPGISLVLWARARSTALLERPVPIEMRAPVISDTVSVSRGEHLVRNVLDCGGCHGDDLGGAKVLDSWLLGRFFAPNLTKGPGGIGDTLDTEAWDRALRHGVDSDGRVLLYMPSRRYASLTDQDFMSVVAYLKKLPGQEREMLDSDVGPMFRLLVASGALEIDAHQIEHDEPPPIVQRGPTVAYGRYLATIAGCLDCHGDDLQGRPAPPGAPDAPAIHPKALEGWTQRDLAVAVRQGRSRDGRALDEYMPWKTYAGLTDEEIDAIFTFLWVGP
ncbi:MAG: c-type cytochrome [Myxococcales bacterium]|nr:c-type cytochrome [Myxococcales bacterium]